MTCLLAVLTVSCTPADRSAPPRFATPIDPITGIVDAFRTHPVVALAEEPATLQKTHAFRLALVGDARFAATVDDIVVEFGNARYQDIADRFVRGEEVAAPLLERVWQRAVSVETARVAPLYQELFHAVRAANGSAPQTRQIRILLGAPSVDGDEMTSAQPSKPSVSTSDRDRDAAATIRREVLEKQRRALLMYSGRRLLRRDPSGNPGPFESIITALEGGEPRTRTFTIWTHTVGGDLGTLQPNVKSWPVPSLILVRRTILGAADFAFYTSPEKVVEGNAVRAGAGLRLEDQFDALLYLGSQ